MRCGGRNNGAFRALTEPFVSTLATLPFAAFWCTALNRNSRIVGRACCEDFPSFACSQFESALLPFPRAPFDVSPLYADPTRSRCKPQSRSLQIGFCDFRQRYCPGSGRLLVCTLLCVAFRLVNSNFTSRVAHIGGLRGLRSERFMSLLAHVDV